MDHRHSGKIRCNHYGIIDKHAMQMHMMMENEDGDDVEVDFPIRFVVCSTCDGKGSHVHPNIDSNGITSEEWAQWDDCDRESYVDGAYDVTCFECEGERVVPEVDESKLSPEQKKFFEQYKQSVRDDLEYEHQCMMERRMETGEW